MHRVWVTAESVCVTISICHLALCTGLELERHPFVLQYLYAAVDSSLYTGLGLGLQQGPFYDIESMVHISIVTTGISHIELYPNRPGPGGGGGFSLLCEDFWIMLDNLFPTCTFFSFFFIVESSSHKLIPLFRPGSVHSGLAS